MTSREKILIGMNEIINSLNNEESIEPWIINGVPDGADDEYIKEMANNDSEFKYCCSLFLDIMSRKTAYEDGMYIDGKIGAVDRNSRI